MKTQDFGRDSAPDAVEVVGRRDPSLRPVIDAIIDRLNASSAVIDGRSPLNLFEHRILTNSEVSDDQIRRMVEVRLEDIAEHESARDRTLRRFPEVRSSINHRFSVDLLAGLTNLDAASISEVKVSLGLTGSALSIFAPLWKSRVPEVQLFTALHDATSVLQSAGVRGINRAVWGQSSTVVSAVVNFPFGAQLVSFF